MCRGLWAGYPALVVQSSVCSLSSLECAKDCCLVLLQLCKVVSAGFAASSVQRIVSGFVQRIVGGFVQRIVGGFMQRVVCRFVESSVCTITS